MDLPEALTDDEIAAASAYDADEWRRLAQGEIALTHEHFYFFFGDIFDVYFARQSDEPSIVFELVRCNPVEDSDEDLAARPATLAVSRDGKLVLLARERLETGYTVRDLAPFGFKQAQWYREGLDRGDNLSQRLLS